MGVWDWWWTSKKSGGILIDWRVMTSLNVSMLQPQPLLAFSLQVKPKEGVHGGWFFFGEGITVAAKRLDCHFLPGGSPSSFPVREQSIHFRGEHLPASTPTLATLYGRLPYVGVNLPTFVG